MTAASVISDLLEEESEWTWKLGDLEAIVDWSRAHFPKPNDKVVPPDWVSFVAHLDEYFELTFVVVQLINWSNETVETFDKAIGQGMVDIKAKLDSTPEGTNEWMYLTRFWKLAERLRTLLQSHLAVARAHPGRLAEEREKYARELQKMAEDRAKAGEREAWRERMRQEARALLDPKHPLS